MGNDYIECIGNDKMINKIIKINYFILKQVEEWKKSWRNYKDRELNWTNEYMAMDLDGFCLVLNLMYSAAPMFSSILGQIMEVDEATIPFIYNYIYIYIQVNFD